jgi:hypothetical protein
VNTGLDEVAKYADAIGPWKNTLAPGSGFNTKINYTTDLADRYACSLAPWCRAAAYTLQSTTARFRAVGCDETLHAYSLSGATSNVGPLLQGAPTRPASSPIHVPQ